MNSSWTHGAPDQFEDIRFTETGFRKLIISHTWQEKKELLCMVEEGTRIEAVRSFFDGGVSNGCEGRIKNRVGSAYVIQSAEILRKTRTR